MPSTRLPHALLRCYAPAAPSTNASCQALNNTRLSHITRWLQTAAKNVEEATRQEDEVLSQLERVSAEMLAFQALESGQEAAAAAAAAREQQLAQALHSQPPLELEWAGSASLAAQLEEARREAAVAQAQAAQARSRGALVEKAWKSALEVGWWCSACASGWSPGWGAGWWLAACSVPPLPC